MPDLRYVTALVLLLIFACTSSDQAADGAVVPDLAAAAGAKAGNIEAGLVTGTCGSCHLTPDPTDLPYGIWDTVVLPRMAAFLGRYATAGERAELLAANPGLPDHAGIYPAQELINDDDWASIRSYYLDRAPRQLPATAFSTSEATTGFTARFPDLFLSPPSTTFVRALGPGGGFLLGDVNKESLYRLDANLTATASLPAGRGLTDATGFGVGDVATVIGSFSPTDEGKGKLLGWTARGPRTIATGLQRPTSLVQIDTNGDGQQEIIVTEYGKWTGRLSLWQKDEQGRYAATTLEKRGGALAVVADTSASVPTVYVLYGQGKEEIVRYSWTAGGMKREVVRAFPPSYGSSSLRLTNWNGDDLPDLLYTNGDNADYISPVKPYHGVRVLTGRADGTFADKVFLPFPGAYGARVADFNQDGRPDIAAVSFFPDFTQAAPAGAVVFSQRAGGTFVATPLPLSGNNRYLTLDAADHDGDGDTDLMAGCLALEPVPDNGRIKKWISNGLPAIVWENQTQQ